MTDTQFTPEIALRIYRTMVRINECDKAIQRGLSSGALQFQYYPCGGQEAIPASIEPLVDVDDYAVITYRCVHDVIAKGTPMDQVVAEMYGRQAGTSKGKGGPMHLSDPHSGLMATTGIVGAGAPIANGLALAEQIRQSRRVTLCSFGDGAANIGAVHEALNMAALWKLPVVFVCQNNLYAEYTSFEESTRSESIASRAEPLGMAGERVDGTDPEAVFLAAARAVAEGVCEELHLKTIMTREVVQASPDDSILDVVRVLEQHQISALPVVADGRVLGLINSDLLAHRYLLQYLESREAR